MNFKFVQIVYLTLAVLLVNSCANIVPLTGGEADKVEPKVIARSIKDSALNFNAGKIELQFDEWITVQTNEVQIYPLTKVKPNVKAIKNKLTINLPDSILEKETTYKISLNNAIKDIHENNTIQNLNINFSTGAYFDSLQLKGKVINAKTGSPDTAAVVVLYKAKNFNDSNVLHTKPLYAQKVSSAGEFVISNLKNTEFEIFALRDKNKNYLYDESLEGFGFLNRKVNPNDTQTIVIYSFDSKTKDSNTIAKTERGGVSSKYYQVNIDTAATATFDFTQPITIKLKTKAESIDKSKILLFQDSVLDASGIISLDSTKTKIIINTDFEQDANYFLVLKNGFTNDTLSTAANFKFKTKKEKDYGILNLKYKSEDKNEILQLYNNGQVIASQFITNDTIYNFKLLLPGTYQAKILQDENNNGQWDSGDFFARKQSETVKAMRSDIIIKASWNNEVIWEEKSSRKR